MAFNFDELKTDWKQLLKNPKTTNNVDDVVDGLVNALKKQFDKTKAVGTDSRGDTHSLTLQ